MKIQLRALKNLIRESLLTETQCPTCGTEGAYVGLNDVECQNPGCTHYVKQPYSDANDIEGEGGGFVMDLTLLDETRPKAAKAWKKLVSKLIGSDDFEDMYEVSQFYCLKKKKELAADGVADSKPYTWVPSSGKWVPRKGDSDDLDDDVIEDEESTP